MRCACRARNYTRLPWFVNTGEVLPHFDVRSDGENIVYFFPKPIPASCTDEVALFKGIVRCLQFLQAKGLALQEVVDETFCQDEEFACLLLPEYKMMVDLDDQSIVRNMQLILSGENSKISESSMSFVRPRTTTKSRLSRGNINPNQSRRLCCCHQCWD